jgi:hypothetical protein
MEMAVHAKNVMTAYLSGAAMEAWYNHGSSEYPALLPCLERGAVLAPGDSDWDPRYNLSQPHYERARLNLLRMGAVGLFERFSDSWEQYRVLWGAPVIRSRVVG